MQGIRSSRLRIWTGSPLKEFGSTMLTVVAPFVFLDADDAPGQAGQDRREDGSPCAVRRVPTGGGAGPASAIPDDSKLNTPLPRNDVEGVADMTGHIHRQTVQRMWCGVISAGINAEKRHRSKHRGPSPPVSSHFWVGPRTDPWARLARRVQYFL
jgi:hypothetical protein